MTAPIKFQTLPMADCKVCGNLVGNKPPAHDTCWLCWNMAGYGIRPAWFIWLEYIAPALAMITFFIACFLVWFVS